MGVARVANKPIIPFPDEVARLAALDKGGLNEPPEPLLRPSDPPAPEPFPIDALPATVRPFVEAVAALFPVPLEVPAWGALVAAATAVGTQRALSPKQGWKEFPTFYAAVVAPTGSAKSAALALCVEPLMLKQKALFDRWKQELAEWQGSEDKQALGPRPRLEHVLTTDATVEALAVMLDASPQGLLVHRDELTGWLNAMDAYRSGRGADLEFWLSTATNQAVKVDRKKGDAIFLERPFVNVLGALVPESLAKFRTGENATNGLYQRLTVIAPDWPPRQVSLAELDPALRRDYDQIFGYLFRLPPVADSTTGRPAPEALVFDDPARAYWLAWLEGKMAEEPDLPPILRGKWPRLEAMALRVAVVLHEVERPGRPPGPIGVDTIHAACRMAGWLMATERRLHALTEIDADERRDRRVRDWIAGRPGCTASARELHQNGVAGIKKTEEARRALASLVERGWARWLKQNQIVEVGGRSE